MTKRQRGFTVPELLISVAIIGIIVSFLGTAVYQILTVTEYGSDKMIALHELQNAAHWFGSDGQMAKTATGGSELVLTLPDDSTITYAVATGTTKLHRTASTGTELTLARNITDLNFLVADRIITMNITSAPEGRPNIIEEGTYKVCLRPTEGE
jgi:prepilin-type N-terminal cleavage/methylation domain-containing protein